MEALKGKLKSINTVNSVFDKTHGNAVSVQGMLAT